MIKLNQLKPGDLVFVNDEGVIREGMVKAISGEEHQALIDNGIQEFWYNPEDITPIPLDETQLLKLGFEKEETEGGVKYKKDSFRLVTPEKGNFSHIDMWWREDRRTFHHQISVHELQNLFYEMTKVHLEKH
ncbi:MAG: hypothetical protein N2747_03705 [Chitinophagaceae bacterium]|nr:hypothetical protein [Chitinophagaceae bacterium]